MRRTSAAQLKMAFLGLTYLGPQDSFRVNMKKAGLLAAFTDDEFGEAFDVAGDAPTLDTVLTLVYRGPPLECDRDRIRAHLDDSIPLTRETLIEAVRHAREDEKRWEAAQRDTVGDGSEFKLVKFYREHISRHQRMSRDPCDKYKHPPTAMMECGWKKPADDEITKTRAGKLTCAETAFAAELYKAGVI